MAGEERKATTRLPDGSVIERDWTTRELLALYMRGWTDGAQHKPQRDDHTDLVSYLRGYNDGLQARITAQLAESKLLDHTPLSSDVLRAKGER